MSGEDEGDAHTLGLLVDLRNLCTKIADGHQHYAHELHMLLRQVQNPNVHGLDKQLTFRVEALGEGETYPEVLLRAVSLNCSVSAARGAFEAAIKAYPTSGWS